MSLPDVVTLDNLLEKLPLWKPDNESHLYAVVDMGSNGIRFSISSLAPPQTRLLTTIFSSRSPISLFDALTPTKTGGHVLSAATISAVADTIAHFSQVAALHDVPRSNIIILATEAMRRADNASELVKAIAESTGGLGVNILEPSVETLFGAIMGSRSALTDVRDGALFLDLGGGSVQMTWVDTSLDSYEIKAASAGTSMPYGAAKLTRVLESGDMKLQSTEETNLRTLMKASYTTLCSTFPKLGAMRDAYDRGEDARINVFMCGGGFRGYGNMLMHHEEGGIYPISSIGTYTVDGATFRYVKEMRKFNEKYDGKIFGMSKRRRRQFDAIATVVEAFTAVVPNLGLITFGRGSNRDGALMMKLPREIRESNPLRVLANLSIEDVIFTRSVMSKIRQAIPADVDLDGIPTAFLDGLNFLFAQQIWNRAGHEDDTNASYALHHAISRDSDCPGFSHLARAILGLTVSARWGSNLSPADTQLAKGLRVILDRHNKDAAFWGQYIGAIARMLVTIFPMRPRDMGFFEKAISFDAKILNKGAHKTLIQVKVTTPEGSQLLSVGEVASMLDKTLKNGDKAYSKRVIVETASI